MIYSTEALLDKNKDFVVAEHAALIRNSASPFVRCPLPQFQQWRVPIWQMPRHGRNLAWQQALLNVCSAT